VDVLIKVFLTSAGVGGEWSAPRSNQLTPGERAPRTHWMEVWVPPITSLNDVEKRKFSALPGFELRSLGRPAHSLLLYRLRYPSSKSITVIDEKNLKAFKNEILDRV
jgi:hypothetical protein